MEMSLLESKVVERVIKNLPVGVIVYKTYREDNKRKIFYVNPFAYRMFGMTKEEYIDAFENDWSAVIKIDSEVIIHKHNAAIQAGTPFEYRMQAKRKDGSKFWLETQTLVRHEPDPVCYVTLTDVSDKVELEKNLALQMERYELLSANTDMLVFDYDVEKDCFSYSLHMTAEKVKTYQVDSYKQNIGSLNVIHPDYMKKYKEIYEECTAKPMKGNTEFLAKVYSKEYDWVRGEYVSLADSDGKVYRIIGKIIDISEEKRAKAALLEKAERDSFTQLLNRGTMEKAVNQIIKNSEEETRHAYMAMDIDDFKQINDTAGHIMGDKVLFEVADILRRNFRRTDKIGRMGGDEFAVLVTDIPSIDFVTERAQNILEEMNELRQRLGVEQQISVSIGIAFYNEAGNSFRELYENADKALYEVKKQQKNGIKIF